MKNRTKKLIAVTLAISFLITPAYAGWVDDWVQQKQETSPGYFSGQKRGYLTGGGFSARWQTGSDYPWNIEPPRFKIGCGGIDLQAGSMGYLNFDAIVAKFEKILQNAPAAAFQMALQTLCQPCVQAINSLTALADQFNSLQVNDCQASKALVASVVPGLTSSDIQNKSGSEALNQAVTGGADAWWDGVKKDASTLGNNFTAIWQHNDANTAPAAGTIAGLTNPSTKACPSNLQQFIPDSAGARKSMLNVVGSARSLSQDYIDLIRGVIGDIELVNNGGQVKVFAVAPCSNQRIGDSSSFLDGSTQTKGYDQNGETNCTNINDANRYLVNYVQTKMQSISDKMKAKSNQFSAQDMAFLNTSPLGLTVTLKTAIGTSNEATIIATMSDITAKAYAYYMLADLYAVAQSTALALEKSLNASSVERQGCDLSAFESDTKYKLQDFTQAIWTMRGSAREQYMSSAQEFSAVQTILQNIVNTQNQLYDRIAKDFGSSVAGRIVKR
jgi:conjugative transfer pilus assembly protein TraH